MNLGEVLCDIPENLSQYELDEINRFSVKTLSCIDEEKRNRMFLYISDKELQDIIIYTFTDEEYAIFKLTELCFFN